MDVILFLFLWFLWCLVYPPILRFGRSILQTPNSCLMRLNLRTRRLFKYLGKRRLIVIMLEFWLLFGFRRIFELSLYISIMLAPDNLINQLYPLIHNPVIAKSKSPLLPLIFLGKATDNDLRYVFLAWYEHEPFCLIQFYCLFGLLGFEVLFLHLWVVGVGQFLWYFRVVL